MKASNPSILESNLSRVFQFVAGEILRQASIVFSDSGFGYFL